MGGSPELRRPRAQRGAGRSAQVRSAQVWEAAQELCVHSLAVEGACGRGTGAGRARDAHLSGGGRRARGL